MFVRQKYIDKIEHYYDKEIIIVLTGQRRVGKSCTLRLLRDRYADDPSSNVIFIDKERREFGFIKTYEDLDQYIESQIVPNKKNYILIDEVQEIDQFERSLRHYRTVPGCQVVATGSNAHIFSTELTTLIGGRYKEIRIQALSYVEFLQFHGLKDSDESLALYIQYGGMPGLQRIGLDADDAREYLSDILHTTLLKDVILRGGIRNADFLTRLVTFLADNTGKLISANSIARYTKTQGSSVNASTIIDYIRMLEEAYIIHRAPRYDIHGKRLFDNNDKFYFEDHGLRNSLCGGSREGDVEKVIENIIYQELRRRGYTVAVGQLQAGEIDFVCTHTNGARLYIQASYLIADETTRHREFGNMQSIKDNYPKYVISLTPMVTSLDADGITHLHLRHFLTDDDALSK